MSEQSTREKVFEEKELKGSAGLPMLVLLILGILGGIALFITGAVLLDSGENAALGGTLLALGGLFGFIVCPTAFAGLKVLAPNEALVMTLFGKYTGTLKGPGFFYVHPFSVAVNPAAARATGAALTSGRVSAGAGKLETDKTQVNMSVPSKKISLKSITLNNNKQKVNDLLGNPIEIGIVVIWRVVNTAKAVFNVDNYQEFLSIQSDSALRNIARLYPYDLGAETDDGDEKSLRGSSQEVSAMLQKEIQTRTEAAGLEILEARITHLAYAPEIAAAMLQRQQAAAIIDARKMIVEGAVGMVQMALDKLSEEEIVQLDEERKAAMVSNLMVVLCSNKDAQPIINSGSLY